MSRGSENSQSDVLPFCSMLPLSRVFSATLSGRGRSSAVTMQGPIGAKPAKFLPMVIWLSLNCTSRAEMSLSSV